jgi:hypothetical protein
MKNWPDEALFGSVESENSPLGYVVRSERDRRIFLLQKDLVAAQLAAAKEQRTANRLLILATVAAFLAAVGSFASVAMTFISAD